MPWASASCLNFCSQTSKLPVLRQFGAVAAEASPATRSVAISQKAVPHGLHDMNVIKSCRAIQLASKILKLSSRACENIGRARRIDFSRAEGQSSRKQTKTSGIAPPLA